MTTGPRSVSRWRRLFLMPTGKRRRQPAPATSTPVVPPKPAFPPRPMHDPEPVVMPTREELVDQVMWRIAARGTPAVPKPRQRGHVLTPVPATPVPQAVKITSLCTPPHGVALTAPAIDMTPDDFLLTCGWEELFDTALKRTDVVAFTIREGGAVVRTSEHTLEIPKVIEEPQQVPHLCKHCHKLSSGDQITGRQWRCGTCQKIAAY